MRNKPLTEEIADNLYKIEIPLPKNPLKAINSYVIKAPERNLIIDTGMNREECSKAMQAGLRELDVDLWKTDFFITHLHADHLGLVSELTTNSSIIYFNQPDADRITGGIPWDDMINFAHKNGFPEHELRAAFQNHPGYKYASKSLLTFTVLKQDDTIRIGDYLFKCIETPGHTKGHMCLYEPNMKLFFSGDHVLNDITPNIQSWSDKDNPLKEYLASLEKVYKLDIEIVLPGHRSIFRNCKDRIQELKSHHKKRAEEVLCLLENGARNAFQVASKMTWDIDCESWDLFPVMQKWFATGEAIAHLRYLEEKGMVQKEVRENKILYSLRP
jgi:glyoxylase-like metal-dependent hydrolase (beta-lactamase superfamily II)